MITLTDLENEFGAGNLVQMPVERYARILRVDPRRLSPEVALPADVPILFTTRFEAQAQLFDLIRIDLGTHGTLRLIVLGAVPADNGLLFCLDATSGEVTQVDLGTPSVEPINASMATFVEFLLRFAILINRDEGRGARRFGAARRLRDELTALDASAFERSDSWWSTAFGQLLS